MMTLTGCSEKIRTFGEKHFQKPRAIVDDSPKRDGPKPNDMK